MMIRRVEQVAISLTLVIAAHAAVLNAQQIQPEFRFGIAVPTGELAEITSTGASVGGGLAFGLSPSLRARLSVTKIMLEEGAPEPGVLGTGIDLLHILGGLEVQLLSATRTLGPVLTANLAAGISAFDVEAYTARNGPDAGSTFVFSDRYFTITGGITSDFALSRALNIFLRAQPSVTFTDEEDMAQFQRISTEIDSFSIAPVIAISIGLRSRF